MKSTNTNIKTNSSSGGLGAIRSATRSVAGNERNSVHTMSTLNDSKNSNETVESKDGVNKSSTSKNSEGGEYSQDREANFAARLASNGRDMAYIRGANFGKNGISPGSFASSSSSSLGAIPLAAPSWSDTGASIASSSFVGTGKNGTNSIGGSGNGASLDLGNIKSDGIKEVASSAEKSASNTGEKGDSLADGGHFTAYNSTDAYNVSWMNPRGNFGSQELRRQVEGGKSLGEALLESNNKQLGNQRLVTAGEAVSKDVGTDKNPVRDLIGIIDAGHPEHGNWFLKGDFGNAKAIAKAGNLTDESKMLHTNDPDKFRAALREAALRNAEAGGGGTLLVTSAAHGGSNQAGNDNKTAVSGFQVGGHWYSETQYEADIAAAKVLGGYDNAIAVNNPCYCGGMDGVDDTNKVNNIEKIDRPNHPDNDALNSLLEKIA